MSAACTLPKNEQTFWTQLMTGMKKDKPTVSSHSMYHKTSWLNNTWTRLIKYQFAIAPEAAITLVETMLENGATLGQTASEGKNRKTIDPRPLPVEEKDHLTSLLKWMKDQRSRAAASHTTACLLLLDVFHFSSRNRVTQQMCHEALCVRIMSASVWRP